MEISMEVCIPDGNLHGHLCKLVWNLAFCHGGTMHAWMMPMLAGHSCWSCHAIMQQGWGSCGSMGAGPLGGRVAGGHGLNGGHVAGGHVAQGGSCCWGSWGSFLLQKGIIFQNVNCWIAVFLNQLGLHISLKETTILFSRTTVFLCLSPPDVHPLQLISEACSIEKYPSSRMANRYTRIFDAGWSGNLAIWAHGGFYY